MIRVVKSRGDRPDGWCCFLCMPLFKFLWDFS
jgi:hypothetical protein